MGERIVWDEITSPFVRAGAGRWWDAMIDAVGLSTDVLRAQRVSLVEAVERWEDFAKAAKTAGLAGFPRRSRGARKHVRRLKAAARARR